MSTNEAPLAIGIDLGTTYSCIAYIDEFGQPVVLKNSEGDSTTPSVVYLTEGSDQVVVGREAKNSKAVEPDNVIEFIKRSIGRKNREQFIGGDSYKPEEISAYILKKIIKDAAEKLGRPINQAVITCPAYFGINEIEATAQAGVIAGLSGYIQADDKKPNIIPEPTAAAFFYGLNKAKEDEIIMVFDLGGGTFDVTLMAVENGSVRSICIGGDPELGGKDWDDVLTNFCMQQAKEQNIDIVPFYTDSMFMGEVSLKIEEAKRMLTAKDKAKVALNFNGTKVLVEITREKFDELTCSLLERTVDLSNAMLKEAESLGYKKFNRLLLVGGSTKMPQIMQRLEKEYPGIPIEFNEPDEAVAKGAALFAWKLLIDKQISDELFKLIGDKAFEKSTSELETEHVAELKQARENASELFGLPSAVVDRFHKTSVVNCTSKSFGVIVVDRSTQNDVIANLILKNSALPAEVVNTFGTQESGQESVKLQIVENTLSDKRIDDLSQGKIIGMSVLQLPPNLPAGAPIEITFRLDNSSLLKYTGREVSSNNIIEGEIKTEAVMSKDEIAEANKRASQKVML